MSMIIKPSASIRNNYNEIAEICKTTKQPVFLTKHGEGDLVVMDIETYNTREAALTLLDKLKDVAEARENGVEDIPASEVSRRMRERIKELDNV